MKTTRCTLLSAVGLALWAPAWVSALQLGDPAPPLAISQWIKGGPVDLKAGRGKAMFVVEFWATWCGPCRVSIPHLTALQKKWQAENVVFVGISDETADKVEPFVGKMADKMDYVVALDRDQETTKAYMGAFEVTGIPHAFVVNRQGNLVWHGHPMGGLDKVLQDLQEGTFDMEAAKRATRAKQLMPTYLNRVSQEKVDVNDETLGRQILADANEDAGLLNYFAWTILTHPRIKHRDLLLATDAARRAMELTHHQDAAILDTYARALYEAGRREEAIEMQRKAIAASDDLDLRGQMEDTLDRYRLETGKK